MRRHRRSVVEVPGNVERMVAKAAGFEGDLLMLDLEDCVPVVDHYKAQARGIVGSFLERGVHATREVGVRINGPTSPWFLDDVMWFARTPAKTLVLPKVYSWRDYVLLEELLAKLGRDDVDVLLIVETARSLIDLERIASEATCLSGLLVGGYDFSLDCHADGLSALGGTGGSFSIDHLSYLRQRVVAVATAYGLDAIDGVVVMNPKDPDQVREYVKGAKDWGFTGCTTMIPTMAVVCNEVFTPTESELEWARRVVATYGDAVAEGRAAYVLDGYVVLPQHKAIAHRLLKENELT